MDFIRCLCAGLFTMRRFKVQIVVHKQMKDLAALIFCEIKPFVANAVIFACNQGWGAIKLPFKYAFQFFSYTLFIGAFRMELSK